MNKTKRYLWQNGWAVYIGNFFLSLIVCGTYVFFNHFSTDDYAAIFYAKGWRVVASSFRVPIAFLYYIVDDLLGYNTTIHQTVFLFILVMIVALAVTLMTREVLKYIEMPNFITFLLVNGSFLLMFENGFFSEWLWFAGGALQWAACIICAVGAAIVLNRDSRPISKVLLGSMFLICGTGSYQLCLVHFVYCYMLLGFVKNKGLLKRKTFMELVGAAVLCAISFAVNVILTKVAISLGLSDPIQKISGQRLPIVSFLKGIVFTLKTVWIDGTDFFPKWFWLVVLVLYLGICVYILINNSNKLNRIVYAFLLCISGMAVMWASGYTQGSMGVTPRQCLYFIGMLSCIIIIPLCLPKKPGEKLCVVETIVLLAVIIYNFMVIEITAVDVMTTMNLDERYYQQVYDRIGDYEEETGNKISSVVVYYDEHPTDKYYEEMIMPVPGHIEIKSMYTYWSWKSAMNYYLDTQYVAGEVDEDLQEYFMKKDWNKIDLDEQMIFDDDTLHLCAY